MSAVGYIAGAGEYLVVHDAGAPPTTADVERAIEVARTHDLERLAVGSFEVRRLSQRSSPAVQGRLARLPAKIAALVFDFDGVFTDNQVIVDQEGREAVSANRSDAFGLAECRELGIPMIVLSTETNPVVQARCNKLRLPFIQGLADKAQQLRVWLDEQGFDPAHVVYVGNDINDLGCLRLVGCAVIPADAHPAVHDVAAIILEHAGGHGAVREIAELVARRVRESR